MNKKASEMWSADTILFWLIYGVALAFVAIFFVIIISKVSSDKAKIPENVEATMIVQRFLKSPNCFILDNAIDVSKFNEQRLNECYNGNAAFRILLSSETAKIYKTIKTRNWNDNRHYESSVSSSVLVIDKSKTSNGGMEIEIQNVQ